MAEGKCRKCGAEPVGNRYSEVTAHREIVIVDEEIQEAILLDKGDKLCNDCASVVAYFRRVE